MAVLRYIVPALAVVGSAAAASCSVSATTTIQSSGDATALASCRTFTGSIALATGTSGNIALDGIEHITGDLTADNATQLTALSGDSLAIIEGLFRLTSLTTLSTLNFPMLSSVQTVDWTTLALLQGLMFQTGLQKVSSLTISDTNLASLTGINLQVADVIEINNNNYLKDINMQLANVTTSMDISNNSPMLSVSLPNLISVKLMNIRNVASVSIPSLSAVNDSLGFYSNTFNSISAPNLTTILGTLAIDANSQLTNATFPVLTSIGGGMQLQNNSVWGKINGYPDLQRVLGAVEIFGPLTEVDLPALNYVRGDFNVQSSQDITTSCNHFDSVKGSFRGNYTCYSHSTATSSNSSDGSSGSGTPTGSSHSGKPSTGLAVPLLIPGSTAMMGVVAAIFGLL